MESPSAQRFQRYRKALALAYILLPVILLLAFAAYGWNNFLSQFVLRLLGNYYGALLLYWGLLYLGLTAVLVLVSLGWFALERSHGLARQSYRSWVTDFCRYRALNWVASSVGVLWFYWAARNAPQRWYLLFWPALVLFDAVLLSFLDSWFLPLFFKVSPLPGGELYDQLSSLAARAGIRDPKFNVLHVGHKTSRSNALVTGLAGRHRILVTDTLLETFEPEEVQAVVAHEIGHQAQHHTTKRLMVLGILYFVGLWLAQWPLRDFVDDLTEFSYLPYLVVGFIAGRLYLGIIFGIFARGQEKSADRFSWTLTQNVPAFVSMLRKLAAQNLELTRRSSGGYHPAADERIRAAEKFLKNQQEELIATAK